MTDQAAANEYLRGRNAQRTRKLLDKGVTDSDSLVGTLGNWETALAGDDRFGDIKSAIDKLSSFKG